MIVASLLLIPVAVLFLALGLINGSSSLLIASIVTSLLVAVILVIGLRQAASARRGAAAEPGPPVEPPAQPVHAERRGARSFAEDSASAAPRFAGDSRSFDDDLEPPPPPPPASAVRVEVADEVPAARTSEDRATVPPAAADSVDSDSTPHSGTPEDYQQASSTIDAARSAESDDHRWRRPAETAPEAAEAGDEFGEPDDDDPDDEPLPQSVRPADAVLIARLDLEVLVVDGRPRYHMADCPHLVGRLTEPLPANEAVELGFSPCGLCRPVDRLVATVAHR